MRSRGSQISDKFLRRPKGNAAIPRQTFSASWGAFVLAAPAAYRRSWLENGVFGKPTRSLAEINRLLLMVAGLND